MSTIMGLGGTPLGMDLTQKNTFSAEETARLQEYADAYNTALRAQQKTGANELGKDDFLKLLIVQLQNQDPTKPLEDKEFIAQMAQFSSLEQSKNMADQLEKFNENFAAQQSRNNSLSFLGKEVEIIKSNGTVEKGLVDSVNLANGSLKVNGEFFSVENVLAVSQPVAQSLNFAPKNSFYQQNETAAPEAAQDLVKGN